MPNVFRRAVSGKTLQKKLSGTVFKAGTRQRFSQQSFKKQLQQSSNPLLRRKLGFNKGGIIKKHQALQTAEAFYKEAAEKKDVYKMDEYKLRKEGVKVEGGKITKIGSEHMYQSMATEELKAEAPIGPSKEELEKEANRKRALAQLNKWRRAREIELEEKQKAKLRGAPGQKIGPQGPAGQGGHLQTGGTQQKNLHIPTMAHGSIGKMTNNQDSSVRSLDENMQAPPDEATVNPLISRLKEEAGITPVQDKGAEETASPADADNSVDDQNQPPDEPDVEPEEEMGKTA